MVKNLLSEIVFSLLISQELPHLPPHTTFPISVCFKLNTGRNMKTLSKPFEDSVYMLRSCAYITSPLMGREGRGGAGGSLGPNMTFDDIFTKPVPSQFTLKVAKPLFSMS